MERKISLEEISDGKLYGSSDLVKADCGGCGGCSDCCRGMGSSIQLDPYDIYRMTEGLHMDFNRLMAGHIELKVVDYVILPNLTMTKGREECSFLNEEGRCTIHPFRPGFCRLFPMGRVYEGRTFRYFLQNHECSRENRTKVKVRKWIDTPDFGIYEKFVSDWHYFLRDLGEGLKDKGGQELMKTMTMYVLKHFYVTPYDTGEGFYPQLYRRLEAARKFAAGQGL